MAQAEWQPDDLGGYAARLNGCRMRVWRSAENGFQHWNWYAVWVGDTDAAPGEMTDGAYGIAGDYTPATRAAEKWVAEYERGDGDGATR